MNDDLADVGLNALEAMEAEDQNQETSDVVENTTDDEETNTTSEEDNSEDTQNEETEDGGEEKDEENTDNEEEKEDATEDGDNSDDEDKDEKDEDKKELSDEEFEKLAKERGYAKHNPEAEEKAKAKADEMTRLTARPDEIDERVWNNMPEENKLIYNALPYIEAEGKDGVIRVKTPEQLPDGFEFKSQKAMMRFQNDLQAQEMKATQMANAISSRAEMEQREEANRAEAQRIVGEVEGLQKSGDLPTPKAKYGTKEFDNDPAVVLINKVLDYKAKRASEGAMLSVRDSLLIYKAEHPEEFVKKEARGDIERRNIAKKVAGNSKATSAAVNGDDSNKPHYYRTGMSTEDVLDAVLNDMD